MCKFVLSDLVFGRVLGGLLQPLVAGAELGPRLRDGLHGGPGHGGRGGGAEMDQSEPMIQPSLANQRPLVTFDLKED